MNLKSEVYEDLTVNRCCSYFFFGGGDLPAFSWFFFFFWGYIRGKSSIFILKVFFFFFTPIHITTRQTGGEGWWVVNSLCLSAITTLHITLANLPNIFSFISHLLVNCSAVYEDLILNRCDVLLHKSVILLRQRQNGGGEEFVQGKNSLWYFVPVKKKEFYVNMLF